MRGPCSCVRGHGPFFRHQAQKRSFRMPREHVLAAGTRVGRGAQYPVFFKRLETQRFNCRCKLQPTKKWVLAGAPTHKPPSHTETTLRAWNCRCPRRCLSINRTLSQKLPLRLKGSCGCRAAAAAATRTWGLHGRRDQDPSYGASTSSASGTATSWTRRSRACRRAYGRGDGQPAELHTAISTLPFAFVRSRVARPRACTGARFPECRGAGFRTAGPCRWVRRRRSICATCWPGPVGAAAAAHVRPDRCQLTPAAACGGQILQ